MNMLSYNPCIEADQNLFWTHDTKESEHTSLLNNARAIILPRSCPERLYQFATRYCDKVFPNYTARFRYPDKTGQALLFQETGVAHPATKVYRNLREWSAQKGRQKCVFPSVFKLAWGGEGKNVTLLETEADLDHCLAKALRSEQAGNEGFLLQNYIPTGGKSLRVVVIGDNYYPYWRITPNGDNFYSNLAKGAQIDHTAMPERQQASVKVLRSFCQQTKIDLAGFDFIFSEEESEPTPLFLEINYCFRCRGLGGHDQFIKLLTDWIEQWSKRTG